MMRTQDTSFCRIRRITPLFLLGGLLLATAASAQQTGGIVALETVSAAPGNTVEVGFEFDNIDGAEVLEARARIQGMDAFSEVDVSAMCDSSAAFLVSCQLNDTNRIVVIAINISSTPILSFTGSIAFTIAADTPGGTDVVLEWDASEDQDLLFTPSQAINGLVSIETDGPQVSLTPDPLTFGALEVGQTSAPQSIEVANSGNADGLTIDGVSTDNPEFNITANGCEQATLAQEQTCSIELTFSPSIDSERSGHLLVETNVGTRAGDLTGTGIAARLAADPEPGELDFGVVAPGDSASIAGQFTNSGTAPLDIDCSLASESGDFHPQPDPLSWSGISPANSVEFTLVFTPTTGEQQSAVLSCQSNAIDQPAFQYDLTTPGTFIFSDRFEP